MSVKSLRERLTGYDLLLILAVIMVIAAIFAPRSFYSIRNLSSILRLSALIGIATLGEALVLLVRGVDVSVGAVMGLASLLSALLLKSTSLGLWGAIVIPLLFSLVVGLVNGLFVVKGKIPAFVTTLGMMWLVRGIAGSITNGQLVQVTRQSFITIADGSLFDLIPYYFVGLLILGLIVFVLLGRTPIGRHIYAVGGSEEAAYFSGIRVGAIRIAVFTVAGLLYGIAGLLMTSYIRAGTPYLADGYEFRAITAAALGGVALSGGEGNILKALLGAVILTIIFSLVTNFSISPYLQGIFEGGILIVAVYLCLR